MEDNAAGGLNALVPVERDDALCTMVSDIGAAKERLRELQQFVRDVMVEGEDYGVIPGTDKPALYKPGAEKLCEIYGLAAVPVVTERVEEWERGFFHYEVRCDLISKRTGNVIGSGLGSCNSWEPKYRWRDKLRACPRCGAETIIKGKQEYGGGWLCWKNKGGCGAKFEDADPSITGQTIGRTENPDPAGLVNTFLKMAKKRALVDAVLSVTRSSALFTQDEDQIEAAPPRRAAAAPKPASGGKKLTAAQRAIIERKAEAVGISFDALSDYIGREYGATSLESLPFEHVNAVLHWLEDNASGTEPGTSG
jgi:hypothetical protein